MKKALFAVVVDTFYLFYDYPETKYYSSLAKAKEAAAANDTPIFIQGIKIQRKKH